jgi:hypothetical protein
MSDWRIRERKHSASFVHARLKYKPHVIAFGRVDDVADFSNGRQANCAT